MLVYRIRTDDNRWLKLLKDKQGKVRGCRWISPTMEEIAMNIPPAEATWWRREVPEYIEWVLTAGKLPYGAKDCFLDREDQHPPPTSPGD